MRVNILSFMHRGIVMNRKKKKKCISMLKTVVQCLEKVEFMTFETIISTLEDCQTILIYIGNALESEEKYQKQVDILEELCEDMYVIYRELVEHDFAKLVYAKEIGMKLKTCISYLQKVQVRPEVLFMPYKASMWDSMDSVYKAALKDGTCNVSVVPIPYYNLGAGRNVIKEEYEGEIFPSYVRVIFYENYCLELENPDIIFIHNPYDEYNYVTQVKECYFSSELCKYTNHLIYIPYFISVDGKISESQAELPGVFNAWKVFVESEKVKGIFLKHNSNAKIIASGSPKYDYIFNINQRYIKDGWAEEIKIKEEWNQKIIGRKVILLNTHLNGLLQFSDLFFDTMREIVETFKNRKDMVLWWRPHPLIKETLLSMRCELYEAYIQLETDFLELENSIYDESSDYLGALIISDAYLGDGISSLRPLYEATGKPVWEILYSNYPQTSYVKSVRGLIYEDEVWMSHLGFNSLFKGTLTGNEIKWISEFPDEISNQSWIHSEVISYNDSLVFVPHSGKHVTLYYPKENKFTSINILKKELMMYQSVINCDKLFLFPVYYDDYIVVIELKSGEIEYVNMEEINVLFKKIPGDGEPAYYGKAIDGDYVFRCFREKPLVFSFNMKTKQFRTYELPVSSLGFLDITFDGENFWILPIDNQELICWNVHTNQIKAYPQCLSVLNKREDILFSQLIYMNQAIWLVPNTNTEMLKVDIETKEVKKIDYPENRKPCKAPGFYITVNNDKMLMQSYIENMAFQINLETGIIQEISLLLPEGFISEALALKIISKSENFRYSADFCPLKVFLDIVDKGSDKYGEERARHAISALGDGEGHAGDKIWKYVQGFIS